MAFDNSVVIASLDFVFLLTKYDIPTARAFPSCSNVMGMENNKLFVK